MKELFTQWKGPLLTGVIFAVLFFLLLSLRDALALALDEAKKAMGQIATQIESRWDALAPLVQAMKNYGEKESDDVREIVALRGRINQNAAPKDVLSDDEKFHEVLRRLRELGEKNPEFQALPLFESGMEQAMSYQKAIDYGKTVYDEKVELYHKKMNSFPTGPVAKILRYKELGTFKSSH